MIAAIPAISAVPEGLLCKECAPISLIAPLPIENFMAHDRMKYQGQAY